MEPQVITQVASQVDWTQTITIIISILTPMLAGFGWIIHQVGELKTRVTIVETILAMNGAPIKSWVNKDTKN